MSLNDFICFHSKNDEDDEEVGKGKGFCANIAFYN